MVSDKNVLSLMCCKLKAYLENSWYFRLIVQLLNSLRNERSNKKLYNETEPNRFLKSSFSCIIFTTENSWVEHSEFIYTYFFTTSVARERNYLNNSTPAG